MRKLDSKRTQQVRDRHEQGVNRLNELFHFAPDSAPQKSARTRPEALRLKHKRERMNRRKNRAG